MVHEFVRVVQDAKFVIDEKFLETVDTNRSSTIVLDQLEDDDHVTSTSRVASVWIDPEPPSRAFEWPWRREDGTGHFIRRRAEVLHLPGKRECKR